MQRTTFTLPEQLRPVTDDEGNPVIDDRGRKIMERIPNHPTRPARPHEVNVWWENEEET